MDEAKIFLIDSKGKSAKEMVETPYEAEDVLQHLLVLKPDLLPGNQLNPENPRRWLLVKQEMGVPDQTSGGCRWSLDHLFLDQDGVPTFVECKKASDTRNRREVVAQMLDYAANGLEYWGMDRLRQAAAETAHDRNRSLEDELKEWIGVESEEETENYWKAVEDNLQSGRVRLVFVADDIPKELRRLVEFLNEKLTNMEVIAVEIKQYLGDGLRAVVPRAIGLSEKSREIKQRPTPKRPALNREEFLAKCTAQATEFFKYVLHKAQEKNYDICWGSQSFSIRAHLADEEGKYNSFLYGWYPNRFEVYLAQMPLSKQESLAFRKELMAFGIFKEAGDWTLRTILNGESLTQISKAYDIVLNKMDEIIRPRD